MLSKRKQYISILGSTGSIGHSTLQVVKQHPERFKVVGLAANNKVSLFIRQIEEFKPQVVALSDEIAAQKIITYFKSKTYKPKTYLGSQGVEKVATLARANLVVSAIVGQAGLLPTLAAIEAGKDIALANKETLVVAGDLVMSAVRRKGVKLLPVDSEHAALQQCLRNCDSKNIRRIILTASGGPFAKLSWKKLQAVTVKQALCHPTWNMGPKITIDSATLMNKGLEIIEAHHLFGIAYNKISVLVHPQSIVHALVELVDGSMLAQLATPDMRLPIQAALTDPECIKSVVKPIDFSQGLNLSFTIPDKKKFSSLQLAIKAGQQGGTMPAVLNAANEIAVQAFLENKISFLNIPRVVAKVMKQHKAGKKINLADIISIDKWAREKAQEVVER